MTILNSLKQIKNVLYSTKEASISQNAFLMQMQTVFDIRQPIWCNTQDTFAVSYESLVKAENVTVAHSIGRMRLNLDNSDVQEIWIDCDNHDNLPFKEFKEQRLLPSYHHLLNLGVPPEYIYPKISGTGVHLHVFVKGLPKNFDAAELLMKSAPGDADPRSKVQATKLREFGAYASVGGGKIQQNKYAGYIADLSKLKKIEGLEQPSYPILKAFDATKQFMQQLSFIEMDKKQEVNEKDEILDYERDGDFNNLYKCPLLTNLAKNAKEKHHLYHNDRLFIMSQFLHFGDQSRREIHKIIEPCSDYDEGYTQSIIDHAMRRGYHPFTCKWAHDNKLGCPADCRGSGGKSPLKFAWTPMSLDELKQEYRKLLLLAPEDDEIIEIALSQMLDPQFPGEMAWLFLIAPPSWAKTVILLSVNDPKWSTALDKITDKTFISGKTKFDPKIKQDIPIDPLLPKLHKKTLIFKEFTTVLMSGEDERKMVFGQLRAIFDENYCQAFGSFDFSLIPEDWKHVRMGFFGGCTPYIDKYSVLNVALGERYLKVRMRRPDRLAAIRYARLGSQEKDKKVKQLQKKVKRFIANLKLPEIFEQPPEDIGNALDYLSEFLVQARSPVEKEVFNYGGVSYEYPDEKELGTRVVQQLVRKGWALTVVCNRPFDKSIYAKIVRIVFDTLLPARKEMILYLYSQKSPVSVNKIRKDSGWGYDRVANTLTELKFIEVVNAVNGDEENHTRRLDDNALYELNGYIRKLLDTALSPLPEVRKSLGISSLSQSSTGNYKETLFSTSESSRLHGDDGNHLEVSSIPSLDGNNLEKKKNWLMK